MSKTYAFTQDAAQVGSQVKTIVKSAKAFETNLRRVMVNVVLCAMEHGNVTPATQLVDGLKDSAKSIRANAVAQWFETIGPFTWDNENKRFKLDRETAKVLNAKLKATTLAKFAGELMATELTKEAEYKGFDLMAQVASLIKRAETIAANDDKKDDPKTDLSGLVELKSFLKRTDTTKATANESAAA